MMDLLHKLIDHFETALVGIVGALISLRFHPERKEAATAISFIITGGCIAYFTTGLVAEFFSIAAKHAGAVGFLLGAFGGSLFAAITKAIQNADLWEFVRSKWGGQ